MKKIDLDKLFTLAGSDILPLEESLHDFARLLRRNFSLRLSFENELIPAEERKTIIKEIKSLPLFEDLIAFLLTQGLQKHVIELAQQFTELVAKRLCITFVDVESPHPLSESEKKSLESLIGGQVRLRSEIVPKLLGGIRFTTSDGRYCDGSLPERINQLKERLTYA